MRKLFRLLHEAWRDADTFDDVATGVVLPIIIMAFGSFFCSLILGFFAFIILYALGVVK